MVAAARPRCRATPAARTSIPLRAGGDGEPDEKDRRGIDWVFLKPLDIGQIAATFRQTPPDSSTP